MSKTCQCITQMNEALEPHNARLDVPMLVDMKDGRTTLEVRVQVPCYKIDPKKRKPLPALLAQYCPFCGDRYAWPDPATLDDGQLQAELDRATRQKPVLEEKGREFHWERSRRERAQLGETE